MAQTTINFEGLAALAKAMEGVNIEVSEPQTFTYYITYRYRGCSDFFTKEIICENLEDALNDAKDFIKENNASVIGKSKEGNFIDYCFIKDEGMKTIGVVNAKGQTIQ